MEPQGNRFGGFGGLSPDDMENVRAALERRGMGDQLPALMQQTAGSATAAPPVAPNVPQGGGGLPAPQGQPLPQQPIPAEQPQPEQMLPAVPPASPEAEIILRAMADRLKIDSKIREAQMVPETPQQPQPLQELAPTV